MDVGEERGRLAEELAAAARRLDPHVHNRLAATLGRRQSATHFAAALARLLAHHQMTLSLVSDAGRLIGPHDARFAQALPLILDDIEGGGSLADALARHSRIFDPLFVRCVERAHTRESLRLVLERLAESSVSPAVLV
jgi:type II secretory pathway component PulF